MVVKIPERIDALTLGGDSNTPLSSESITD